MNYQKLMNDNQKEVENIINKQKNIHPHCHRKVDVREGAV